MAKIDFINVSAPVIALHDSQLSPKQPVTNQRPRLRVSEINIVGAYRLPESDKDASAILYDSSSDFTAVVVKIVDSNVSGGFYYHNYYYFI